MKTRRALVIGATGEVGRPTVEALSAAGMQVTGAGRERDATDPAQVHALLTETDPDVVVVAAGARPRMAAIDEHDWASFSAAWEVDVRITFEVGRAALTRPLRPGSTVVFVSSGAALAGSPLSGGYAGAKRTQMFMADSLRRTADARGLGIRFAALAPQLIAGTPIAAAAAAAYAERGESIEDYLLRRFPVPLDPAGVARTIVGFVESDHDATLVPATAGDAQLPGDR